jgi:hypothetical protein
VEGWTNVMALASAFLNAMVCRVNLMADKLKWLSRVCPGHSSKVDVFPPSAGRNLEDEFIDHRF